MKKGFISIIALIEFIVLIMAGVFILLKMSDWELSNIELFSFVFSKKDEISETMNQEPQFPYNEDSVQTSAPSIETLIPISTPRAEMMKSTEPAILFEDDFEDGLSDEWDVVSGNPLIVNGKLTTDQDTWLLVGDPNWENVSVEFNTNFERSTFGTGTSFNGIGVRVKDIDNMYFIRWGEYQDGIFIIDDGNWNELPNTGYDVVDKEVNLRITVVDGQVALYDNGIKALSFFDTRFKSGRVAVHIFTNSTFDDFRIKEILD